MVEELAGPAAADEFVVDEDKESVCERPRLGSVVDDDEGCSVAEWIPETASSRSVARTSASANHHGTGFVQSLRVLGATSGRARLAGSDRLKRRANDRRWLSSAVPASIGTVRKHSRATGSPRDR